MRTHYDNLHVSEKAGPEVIRAAYKALAQKWHPDKHPHQREKAERYFKIISDAFEVLSDSEARAAYDAGLAQKRSQSEGARPTDGSGNRSDEPSKPATAPSDNRNTTINHQYPSWWRSLAYAGAALFCIWAIGRYDLSELITGANHHRATASSAPADHQPAPPRPAPPSHADRIYAVHPDANAIAASASFQQWVSADTERGRVAESGTADEVIALISGYRVYLSARMAKQPSAPVSITPQRTSYPNCVFYPAMTDADYAACGLTPPGK